MLISALFRSSRVPGARPVRYEAQHERQGRAHTAPAMTRKSMTLKSMTRKRAIGMLAPMPNICSRSFHNNGKAMENS